MKMVLFPTLTGSPDSAEWHQWRAGGIGGSDAPVIGVWKGLNSKAAWMKPSAFLWMVKTGQLVLKNASNWATERGRSGEEAARQAFEQRTGIILQPVFGEMDQYPFIRSSFDGMDFFQTAIGEIKCPGVDAHEKARKGEIPDYYFTQMLHQGLTAWGAPSDGNWVGKRMFYISYIPELGDIVWVEVICDDWQVQDKAEELLAAEIEFWAHIQNETDPAGETWKDAAEAYIKADLEFNFAKSALESCKATLESLLGDRDSFEGSGLTVAKSSRSGAVSYKDAAETLMRWYGVDPQGFLPQFRGADSSTLSVRVKREVKKRKAIADGGLSLDSARNELARIAAQQAAPAQAAFGW